MENSISKSSRPKGSNPTIKYRFGRPATGKKGSQEGDTATAKAACRMCLWIAFVLQRMRELKRAASVKKFEKAYVANKCSELDYSKYDNLDFSTRYALKKKYKRKADDLPR